MDVEVIVTNGDGPDVDALDFRQRAVHGVDAQSPVHRVRAGKAAQGGHDAREAHVDRMRHEQAGGPIASASRRRRRSIRASRAMKRPHRRRHPAGAFHLCAAGNLRQARRPRAAEGLPADRGRRHELHAAGARKQPDRGRLHRQPDSSSSPPRAASRSASPTIWAAVIPPFDDFLFELVYARPEFPPRSDGETVRRFLRALLASVNEILDTPSATHMPALKALFGGAGDDVILESFENTKSIFSRDGVVTPGSVQKAGSFMVESGAVKTAARPSTRSRQTASCRSGERRAAHRRHSQGVRRHGAGGRARLDRSRDRARRVRDARWPERLRPSRAS